MPKARQRRIEEIKNGTIVQKFESVVTRIVNANNKKKYEKRKVLTINKEAE